jgi:tryptophanyl-tRNA synthetase
MKKRVLSGLRPTERVHIGNYLGALKNWAEMQDKYDCFYMIADWHAMMSEYAQSRRIKEVIPGIVADWIACGIDPEKSTIFVQSAVPEHTELHLLLSCITPLGWLERCPTYKEQIKQLGDEVTNYGFLGYPVLQTADIVLYKAELVPVGEDQVPHLELAREIVRRFNSLYGNIFPEPQAKLTQTSRILGIDGSKMSKSYGNAIYICDSENTVKKKIMTMFTDPLRIKRTDVGHPDTCNVFTYHKLFNKEQRTGILVDECRTAKIGCTDCKSEIGDILVKYLKPMREKSEELLRDKKNLTRIIEDGDKKAKDIASKTMKEVIDAVFGGQEGL